MGDTMAAERPAGLNPLNGHRTSVPKNELTSARVKYLAGKALREPKTLTNSEIQELGGSVLAHIERPAKK
jgi:hypothetical protein